MQHKTESLSTMQKQNQSYENENRIEHENKDNGKEKIVHSTDERTHITVLAHTRGQDV